MNIIINNTSVEVLPGETVIETARRAGYAIPSLCYGKGAKHKSSCMVCAVKSCPGGQMIPSCTTIPTEGMQIETDTEEVLLARTLSLELLLSDHRADCEAPCSMVCPEGLDVEKMLDYYDKGQLDKACVLIGKVFALPQIACDTCKAPCEKTCRRGTVDKAVAIRAIIKEIVDIHKNTIVTTEEKAIQKPDKTLFNSRLGRFSAKEKETLKQTVTTPSNCLHCACSGRTDCKLRKYATDAGIKRSRYNASSALPVMKKEHITGNLWFEQAKCIRCGLCVYNSSNGFTFKGRGFEMQVVIPHENKPNVSEEIAALCPTGALYLAARMRPTHNCPNNVCK